MNYTVNSNAPAHLRGLHYTSYDRPVPAFLRPDYIAVTCDADYSEHKQGKDEPCQVHLLDHSDSGQRVYWNNTIVWHGTSLGHYFVAWMPPQFVYAMPRSWFSLTPTEEASI